MLCTRLKWVALLMLAAYLGACGRPDGSGSTAAPAVVPYVDPVVADPLDVLNATRKRHACLRPNTVDYLDFARRFEKMDRRFQFGWLKAAENSRIWPDVNVIYRDNARDLTNEFGGSRGGLAWAMIIVMSTTHPDAAGVLVDDVYGCNDFGRQHGAGRTFRHADSY